MSGLDLSHLEARVVLKFKYCISHFVTKGFGKLGIRKRLLCSGSKCFFCLFSVNDSQGKTRFRLDNLRTEVAVQMV